MLTTLRVAVTPAQAGVQTLLLVKTSLSLGPGQSMAGMMVRRP